MPTIEEMERRAKELDRDLAAARLEAMGALSLRWRGAEVYGEAVRESHGTRHWWFQLGTRSVRFTECVPSGIWHAHVFVEREIEARGSTVQAAADNLDGELSRILAVVAEYGSD